MITILALTLYLIGAACATLMGLFFLCLGGNLKTKDVLITILMVLTWPISLPFCIIRFLLGN